MKAPTISQFHFADELNIGMRAAVTCAVIDGDPPFQFTWSKDGKVLQENDRVSFKTHDFMSTLVISNLGPESNGKYTCSVTNAAGKDEKFSTLNMKGK